MAETMPASPPFAAESFVWRKWGPLPAWAWMGLALGLALVVSVWQRNREAAQSAVSTDSASTDATIGTGYHTAPPVWVNNVTLGPVNTTVPTAPPGGGRAEPPQLLPPPKFGLAAGTDRKWTDRLAFAWEPVAGATSYRLRDDQTGAEWDLGNVTTYTRQGLVHNGSYFHKLAAVKDGKVQSWSPLVTAMTKN